MYVWCYIYVLHMYSNIDLLNGSMLLILEQLWSLYQGTLLALFLSS